jgi:hypothetical protein
MKRTLSEASGRSIREVALVRREASRLVRIGSWRHGAVRRLRVRPH